MNAFGAKLSTFGVPALDERPRAAAIMRDTLEKAPWETYHHPDLENEEDPDWDEYPVWRAHEIELRDIKTLNGTVPAAAVWIKVNGKGLYEMKWMAKWMVNMISTLPLGRARRGGQRRDLLIGGRGLSGSARLQFSEIKRRRMRERGRGTDEEN
jgi:hypothetical protein